MHFNAGCFANATMIFSAFYVLIMIEGFFVLFCLGVGGFYSDSKCTLKKKRLVEYH